MIILRTVLLLLASTLLCASLAAAAPLFKDPAGQEAERVIMKEFQGKLIVCGGSTFYKVEFTSSGALSKARITEFKTTDKNIKGYTPGLSQNDKLNGVEWSGKIEFSDVGPNGFYPSRVRYIAKNGEMKPWSQWGHTYDVQAMTIWAKKENGKWNVDLSQGRGAQYVPLTCEEATRP